MLWTTRSAVAVRETVCSVALLRAALPRPSGSSPVSCRYTGHASSQVFTLPDSATARAFRHADGRLRGRSGGEDRLAGNRLAGHQVPDPPRRHAEVHPIGLAVLGDDGPRTDDTALSDGH